MMTKIAVIADTHFGARGDNRFLLDWSREFFTNVFFPYLQKNSIQHLIHLGDLVDRRKFINFNTARRLRTDFLTPLEEQHIQTHIICGNHDTTFNNTNDVNALDELIVDKFNNIHVYSGPTEITIDDFKCLLVPWITDESMKETLSLIRSTKAQACFGHLELTGFEMHQGHICENGMSPDVFDKFDIVFSGHFHSKSSSKNILYTGAFMEFTWSDYSQQKGFHIFDTETREVEFIKNPYSVHTKFYYNDTDKSIMTFFDDIDFDKRFKNKFVKVIVEKKNTHILLEQLCEKIEQAGAIQLQIVDETMNSDFDLDDESFVSEAESTLDILQKYIKKTYSDKNVKEVDMFVSTLYNEALTIQRGN